MSAPPHAPHRRPEAWLAQICQTLGLGPVHRVRLTELGRQTWLADLSCGRGHYILRLAKARSPAWVGFERAALAHLGGCGLTVPRPLGFGALPAALVPVVDQALGWGERDFAAELALFGALPGGERATFAASPHQVAAAGAALGWLHKAGESFVGRRRGHLDPQLVPTLLGLGRAFVPCAAGEVGLAQRRDAAGLMARLGEPRLPRGLKRGLVHGEMRPRVVRFVQGTKRPEASLVDLRELAVGPLWVDVGAALCHWGFVADDLSLPLARSFLAGYRTVRPLGPADREPLVAAWRYAAASLALRTLLRHERAPHPSRPYADYRHFLRRLQQLDGLGPTAQAKLLA